LLFAAVFQLHCDNQDLLMEESWQL